MIPIVVTWSSWRISLQNYLLRGKINRFVVYCTHCVYLVAIVDNRSGLIKLEKIHDIS